MIEKRGFRERQKSRFPACRPPKNMTVGSSQVYISPNFKSPPRGRSWGEMVTLYISRTGYFCEISNGGLPAPPPPACRPHRRPRPRPRPNIIGRGQGRRWGRRWGRVRVGDKKRKWRPSGFFSSLQHQSRRMRKKKQVLGWILSQISRRAEPRICRAMGRRARVSVPTTPLARRGVARVPRGVAGPPGSRQRRGMDHAQGKTPHRRTKRRTQCQPGCQPIGRHPARHCV